MPLQSKMNFSGVWSASPTPFTGRMSIDRVAVRRMVDHQIRLGIKGLFLAGTNGEGPWMTDVDRRILIQTVAKYAKGKLPIAVQVTDNSAQRMRENMRAAKEDGADIAVIAPPYFRFNTTPQNLRDLYLETIRSCPLPVGIYDRGLAGSVIIPDQVIKAAYAEPKVVLVKDSSANPERRRIALAARKKRPDLCLLSGDEFNCVEYLVAGYNGLLLGGGVFNGYLALQIITAVSQKNIALAKQLQARMNRIMFDVYGGQKCACWLSGEKHLLVEMGIFRTWKNHLNYPLTQSCQKAIRRVLKKDADALYPYSE